MDLIYNIKWESEHAGARPIHWYPKFLWIYMKYFMKSFSSRFLPEMSYSHLKMQKIQKNKKMAHVRYEPSTPGMTNRCHNQYTTRRCYFGIGLKIKYLKQQISFL